MAHKIRDIMTTPVVCLDACASPRDAARAMRENDIGDVVVEKDKKVCGIITDRDLVIRGLADDGLDQELGDFCTTDVTSVGPDADVGEVIELMESRAIRRVPVIDERGHAIGIVSIGDLAQTRDPNSALGQISAAPPNH
jgi:CBS domain-containing protein